MTTANETRETVRKAYADVATKGTSCCGPECCSDDEVVKSAISEELGYTAEELAKLPEGADLGLGSGNPVRAAGLTSGEVVVDLGSGAGIDCFLASHAVGPEGRVIGVDMTPEMISRARGNAEKAGVANVEFRLGEIEALPVADETADVVISNCVINLSPERDRALAEAFRILKPGGRLVISDMISEDGAPEELSSNAAATCACLPVARDEYFADLRAAGFSDVKVLDERSYPAEELSTVDAVQQVMTREPELGDQLEGFLDSVRGAVLYARKV